MRSLLACTVFLAASSAGACGSNVIVIGGGGGQAASTETVASAGGGGASSASSSSQGGGAADVVSACVIAASCAATEPQLGVGFSPSRCVDAFAWIGWTFAGPSAMGDPEIAARLLACAKTSDCAAFRSCYGGSWIDVTRCREGAQCQNNALVAGKGLTFDCGAIGATCAVLWSDALRACCNATPCDQPQPVSCKGTHASACGGWGERLDVDCAVTGRICKPGAPSYQACAGPGAPCDPQTPVSCKGTVASYCASGSLASFDCASNGYRTACAAGSYLPCKPAGNACDPSSYAGTCQGTALSLCVNGTTKTVSCTALGFTTCKQPVNGTARCE